jgi:alkylation response protein AidB-like acyl-CoA dehydrogenase
MDLSPTPEQALLRESAHKALAVHGGHARWRRAADGDGTDADVWRLFADLGWLGLPFAEDVGGSGGGTVEAAILAEAMGRALAVGPWAAAVVLAGGIVERLGTPAQRRAILGPLIAGRERPAFALGATALAHPIRTKGGWRLVGRAALVPGGAGAATLLVPADLPDGDRVVLAVPADAPGVTLSPVRTIDGGASVDARFDGVELGPDALLGDRRDTRAAAHAAVRAVVDRWIAVLCADAVGSAAGALAATVGHTRQRVQFGRPLADLQALRHRMAEMAVTLETARASALLAALTADAEEARRTRAVAGARLLVADAARRIAHEAVQLHGAMGCSEEVAVGAWLRRIAAFDAATGSTADHVRRYAGTLPALAAVPLVLDPAAGAAAPTLHLSPADAAFRDTVRAFLDAELTPDLRRAERLNPSFLAHPDVGRAWQATVHAHGWSAPSWPAEHGGPGWSLVRRYLFDQECEAAGEPRFRGAGIKMLGPVLMRFGTPAQQAFYLPRILSGADLWAQGYSEPGAGSDLAALATRAVRDGDAYVVTGTKIWSTLAHAATRMFALVRTADTGKRQEGITFLLVDLSAPGVTIRPIRSTDGSHEFNQIFLDAVRVPVADRVGAEGEGWEIAKYLLEFERGGSFAAGALRALLARLLRLASAPGPDGRVPLDDPLLAARIATIGAQVDANEMLELTVLSDAAAGGRPGAVQSSTLKILRSRIRQAIAQATLEALGPDALRWEAHRPLHDLPEATEIEEERRVAGPAYVAARAQSLFGGSNEIQLEILARALLS